MNIYIYKSLNNIDSSILTKIFDAKSPIVGKLFQEIPTAPFAQMITIVPSPEEADALLLPHNYFKVKTETSYLNDASALAGKYNIPLLVFTLDDETTPIVMPHSIVLRPSFYKSKRLPNERVIPAFVEDVGAQFGHEPRRKESVVPSIGFSGMVQLSTVMLELRYQLRTLWNRLQACLGIISTAEYQGLYYRRKAISVIERSPLCEAKFNIRNTFSANIKTIQGDPKTIRREFVDSIKNSDLSLVVRGNGNYSLRLFEILSLGRIPLFIDTDSPLPLDDIIEYDSFMIRVDHKDIDKIPKIVDEFWKNTTPEEYLEMQRRAREVFATKLKPDVFYKLLFEELSKR